MRWCWLNTKLFALYIRVLVTTELVVSGTQCITACKRSLGQGNVFKRVCYYVHKRRGISLYDVTSHGESL